MGKKIISVTLDEFITHVAPEELFNNEFVITEMDGRKMNNNINSKHFPVRLDMFSIVLMCEGELVIGIDNMTYLLKKNTILEMLSHHIIEHITFTSDFKAYHILISKDLFRLVMDYTNIKLPPPDKLSYRRLQPVHIVEAKEMNLLLEIMNRIRGHIANKDHYFRDNIIQSELSTFLFEMGQITFGKNINKQNSYEVSHKEEIIGKFIRLLIENCKEQHEVSFYSTELCITPEYLSRIMKSVSGKTVTKWISDTLVAEAKLMLRKSNTTIQEIADELNFSDQSSFGKFFKKNTGMSPSQYKQTIEDARLS